MAPYRVIVAHERHPNLFSLTSSAFGCMFVDDNFLGDKLHAINDQPVFPLTFSVFSTGRVIFRFSGLTLDTFGENTWYEVGTCADDREKIANPRLLQLVMKMLQHFPPDSRRFEWCRADALHELDTGKVRFDPHPLTGGMPFWKPLEA